MICRHSLCILEICFCLRSLKLIWFAIPLNCFLLYFFYPGTWGYGAFVWGECGLRSIEGREVCGGVPGVEVWTVWVDWMGDITEDHFQAARPWLCSEVLFRNKISSPYPSDGKYT